jgi:uncharacterized protein DUF4160
MIAGVNSSALLLSTPKSHHHPDLPDIGRAITFVLSAHAGDRSESPHIHIERAGFEAKVWLDPVVVERSGGFGRSELNRINLLVIEHRGMLVRAWNDFFDETD